MGVFTDTIPTFTVERARASKLQTLADFATAATGAWTTWSPTLTNLTLGSGTQVAKYRRLGNTVDWIWIFTYGSGSAVGAAPQFTLPVAASGDYTTYPPWFGMLTDASTTARAPVLANLSSTTTVVVQYFSSLNSAANLSSTIPWIWATSDVLTLTGTYYTA